MSAHNTSKRKKHSQKNLDGVQKKKLPQLQPRQNIMQNFGDAGVVSVENALYQKLSGRREQGTLHSEMIPFMPNEAAMSARLFQAWP